MSIEDILCYAPTLNKGRIHVYMFTFFQLLASWGVGGGGGAYARGIE